MGHDFDTTLTAVLAMVMRMITIMMMNGSLAVERAAIVFRVEVFDQGTPPKNKKWISNEGIPDTCQSVGRLVGRPVVSTTHEGRGYSRSKTVVPTVNIDNTNDYQSNRICLPSALSLFPCCIWNCINSVCVCVYECHHMSPPALNHGL